MLKKKAITTEKLLHIDVGVLTRAVCALKNTEGQVQVHFKLKNQIMLNEMKPIMVPLAYPVHYALRVLFFFGSNEVNTIAKDMSSLHPNITCEVQIYILMN
jgi:hypothetical protein